MHYLEHDSPLGRMLIAATDRGLRHVAFEDQRHFKGIAGLQPGSQHKPQHNPRHPLLPKAVRAVGAANGRNPIAIIVPCHRVIGAAGTLVGYAGGLERKRFLLALESGQEEILL